VEREISSAVHTLIRKSHCGPQKGGKEGKGAKEREVEEVGVEGE